MFRSFHLRRDTKETQPKKIIRHHAFVGRRPERPLSVAPQTKLRDDSWSDSAARGTGIDKRSTDHMAEVRRIFRC